MTAAFAMVAVAFRNSYALGEIDVAWMVAGVVHGTVAHEALTGALHYGASFSFGFYALLYALVSDSVRADPAALAVVVNWIGIGALVVALPLTWAYLARVLGGRPAAFAVAVFFFSPLVLHLTSSGHPLLLAYALCMLAALVLDRWPLVGTAVLTGALSVRAEVALLIPFIIVFERHGAIRRAAWCIAALAGFFLLQHALVPTPQRGAGSIIAAIASYYDVAAIPRGVALLALSSGFATSGTVAYLVWKRGAWKRREAVVLAALALPALVAWLPNPQPVRHFFIVTLAMALLLAWRLQSLASRPLVFAALALVAGNQLLAEAAYPAIVHFYPWAHGASEGRRSVYWAPLGAFMFDAPARRREQEALYSEAIQVLRQAHGAPRFLVVAHNDRYLVARFIAADPYLVPSIVEIDGISYQELRSGTRLILIARLWDRRPADTAQRILASPRFAGWPVYVQRFARN